MNLQQTILILNKFRLAFPNFELTENTIKLWHELFVNERPETFNNALVAAVKEPGRAFFPSPGEVQAYILKGMPSILTIRPSEALDYWGEGQLLIHEARKFADRINPDNSKTQYSSPEELAKANEIRRACWKRDFKEKFETLQSHVKANVIKGISLYSAIEMELGLEADTFEIDQPVQKLIDDLC